MARKIPKAENGTGGGFRVAARLVYKGEERQVEGPIDYIKVVQHAGALLRHVLKENPPFLLTCGRSTITSASDFEALMARAVDGDVVDIHISIDKQNRKASQFVLAGASSGAHLGDEDTTTLPSMDDDDRMTLATVTEKRSVYQQQHSVNNNSDRGDLFSKPVDLNEPYAEAGHDQHQMSHSGATAEDVIKSRSMKRDQQEVFHEPIAKNETSSSFRRVQETSSAGAPVVVPKNGGEGGRLAAALQNDQSRKALVQLIQAPSMRPVLEKALQSCMDALLEHSDVVLREVGSILHENPSLEDLLPASFHSLIDRIGERQSSVPSVTVTNKAASKNEEASRDLLSRMDAALNDMSEPHFPPPPAYVEATRLNSSSVLSSASHQAPPPPPPPRQQQQSHYRAYQEEEVAPRRERESQSFREREEDEQDVSFVRREAASRTNEWTDSSRFQSRESSRHVEAPQQPRPRESTYASDRVLQERNVTSERRPTAISSRDAPRTSEVLERISRAQQAKQRSDAPLQPSTTTTRAVDEQQQHQRSLLRQGLQNNDDSFSYPKRTFASASASAPTLAYPEPSDRQGSLPHTSAETFTPYTSTVSSRFRGWEEEDLTSLVRLSNESPTLLTVSRANQAVKVVWRLQNLSRDTAWPRYLMLIQKEGGLDAPPRRLVLSKETGYLEWIDVEFSVAFPAFSPEKELRGTFCLYDENAQRFIAPFPPLVLKVKLMEEPFEQVRVPVRRAAHQAASLDHQVRNHGQQSAHNTGAEPSWMNDICSSLAREFGMEFAVVRDVVSQAGEPFDMDVVRERLLNMIAT